MKIILGVHIFKLKQIPKVYHKHLLHFTLSSVRTLPKTLVHNLMLGHSGNNITDRRSGTEKQNKKVNSWEKYFLFPFI